MTTHSTNQEPVPATGPPAGQQQPTPGGTPWPQRTTTRRGRALLIVGIILAFIGVWSMVGGGRAVLAYQDRDGAGYYTTGSESFTTDSYALASPADLSGAGPDMLYARDVKA